MAHENLIARYRCWYARLLRLYSKSYYQRFGEGMEQTFNDLLRERAREDRRLFGYALWMFVETSMGIIRENVTIMITQNKNIVRIVLATAFLLLVPLVAMQVTDEVAWDVGDFVVAGALLFGTGVTYELIARRMGSIAHRVAVAVALAAALLLIWANLAVGLIGSEGEPANLMYVVVLAVGVIGAVVARFRPQGMAWVLFAMALAQTAVAVIALLAGMHRSPGSSVAEIVNVNAVFIVLFILSAALFRRAGAR